ncbi:MAG: hypothetical protein AAF441_25805 [Pseudomonadota bacterium]
MFDCEDGWGNDILVFTSGTDTILFANLNGIRGIGDLTIVQAGPHVSVEFVADRFTIFNFSAANLAQTEFDFGP